MQCDIPVFKIGLHETYLYNLDKTKTDIIPATVFGIASYVDQVLTFEVLLEDGSMFSYIPPSAFVPTNEQVADKFYLSDLVYANCKPGNISVHSFSFLKGKVYAFFKKLHEWHEGTYMWTVDWIDDNQLLHAIKLDCGLIALLPSHKIKFKIDNRSFKPFKKLRSTFSV